MFRNSQCRVCCHVININHRYVIRSIVLKKLIYPSLVNISESLLALKQALLCSPVNLAMSDYFKTFFTF